MKCYGWSGHLNPAQYPGTGNYTPELVFSFHASCPGYGCRIYEPYYHADQNIIEYCNLEGETKGKTFSIRNFSKTPTPRCRYLPQYYRNEDGGYYNETPEYNHCENERLAAMYLCDEYLVPCSPVSDAGCGSNWMVNRTPVKGSPEYDTCMDEAKKKSCWQYLEKVDPATLIMWKSPYGPKHDLTAQVACRLRFEIPSGSGNSTVVSPTTLSPVIPPVPGLHMPVITYSGPVTAAGRQSPVESLFCRILQYLGGKCE